MMDCLSREIMWEYIDGELTGSELVKVAAHLRSCMDCAAQVENLKTVITGVRGMEKIQLSNGFLDRLSERLMLEKKKNVGSLPAMGRRLAGWFAIPKFSLASAVIAAALIFTTTGLFDLPLISLSHPDEGEVKISQSVSKPTAAEEGYMNRMVLEHINHVSDSSLEAVSLSASMWGGVGE